MRLGNYRERYWTDPRAEVRPSPISGNGMFAREPIEEGGIVEIMGGTVMTEAEFEAFWPTVERFNAVQIADGLHLVELPEVTKTRRGSKNHSCDSNLWMADETTVVARRDIAAGDELTVDYALFTASPDWILTPCNCGSSSCRKTVSGNDWKISEVQERYRGHFSPFINARIAGR